MKDRYDLETEDWVEQLYEIVRDLRGQVVDLKKRVRRLERDADLDLEMPDIAE
jgi:hypothetical protein